MDPVVVMVVAISITSLIGWTMQRYELDRIAKMFNEGNRRTHEMILELGKLVEDGNKRTQQLIEEGNKRLEMLIEGNQKLITETQKLIKETQNLIVEEARMTREIIKEIGKST